MIERWFHSFKTDMLYNAALDYATPASIYSASLAA